MNMFYILSLKHTRRSDDYITLWRPNDAGYTLYIPAAGLYSLAEIEARPDYYNNGRSTVAIPSLVVSSRGIEADPGYDCAGPVLKNTDQNWSTLMTYRLERTAVTENESL